MFKKLATLVCATAIATSAFTGMVANAALVKDQGINIVAERVDGADDQITLSVYAVGFDAIRNWGLNLAVTGGTLAAIDPEDYEADDAANVSSLMFNVDTDNNVFVSTGSANKSVALDDNLIFTATLSFTEDISSDITITLDDASTLKMGDKTTLKYYSSKPDSENTLGFNDAVVSAPVVTPPTPVVSTTPGVSRAFTEADNYDANVVVGTIELTVSGAPINLREITYNDKKPQSVEGYANPEAFEGTAVITVIINGETDVDALNNIKFN